MEDDVQQLYEYLPIKVSEPRLQNLISHHLSSFMSCIEHELYSSSLSHLHILYMVFVYLQIQRIAEYNEESYKHSLIGFSWEEKELLKEPKFPLSFSIIKEKTVFRLLRLNNIDDETINKASKPVDRRNNHLHASEKIECETAGDFAGIFNDYVDNMNNILTKNINLLNKFYEDPSVQQLNDEDYEITDDDLEQSLFIPNYFSIKELELICKGRNDNLSKKLTEDFGYIDD